MPNRPSAAPCAAFDHGAWLCASRHARARLDGDGMIGIFFFQPGVKLARAGHVALDFHEAAIGVCNARATTCCRKRNLVSGFSLQRAPRIIEQKRLVKIMQPLHAALRVQSVQRLQRLVSLALPL